MNLVEYQRVIRRTIRLLVREVDKSALRNRFKDMRVDDARYGSDFATPYFVKGWEGCNLIEVLKEEFQEFLENPTKEEAGDIAWTLAMMVEAKQSRVT